jgi:NADPH2:quinone reductase
MIANVSATMKAVVVRRYGGPEVLELADLPIPEPGAGQVSIDVRHAGLNFAEVLARQGAIPAIAPPFTPGLEVAGTVRGVGPGVSGLSPGDHVCALTVTGGYAEVTLASAEATYLLGALADRLTPAQAAALPTIVPTSLAVCELGRVREGETVMVQAAAGGVGSVVGQVARALGAGMVIGIVGNERKRPAAEGFGYDHVVMRDELAERVAELTGRRGVDVLLDGVGGPRRRDALELLAPLGRLVAYGNASGQPEPELPSGVLRTSNKAVVGFSITALKASTPRAVRELTRRAFELVERGAIELRVTREMSLDEVRTAHDQLGGGESTGKLVLRVDGAGQTEAPARTGRAS